MAFKTLLCGEGAPQARCEAELAAYWHRCAFAACCGLLSADFLPKLSTQAFSPRHVVSNWHRPDRGYGLRYAGGIYHQIWRFANTAAYLRMMLLDFAAGWLCVLATPSGAKRYANHLHAHRWPLWR